MAFLFVTISSELLSEQPGEDNNLWKVAFLVRWSRSCLRECDIGLNNYLLSFAIVFSYVIGRFSWFSPLWTLQNETTLSPQWWTTSTKHIFFFPLLYTKAQNSKAVPFHRHLLLLFHCWLSLPGTISVHHRRGGCYNELPYCSLDDQSLFNSHGLAPMPWNSHAVCAGSKAIKILIPYWIQPRNTTTFLLTFKWQQTSDRLSTGGLNLPLDNLCDSRNKNHRF